MNIQFQTVSPTELKKQVRDLILNNPDRHRQSAWVCNIFTDDFTEGAVDRLRNFAHLPIPESPMSSDGLCGTQACVAGWGGILGSPPGTRIRKGWYGYVSLVYPDGTEESLVTAVTRFMDLDEEQADWLFDSERSKKEILHALDMLIEDPRYVFVYSDEYAGGDDEDDYDEDEDE